MMRGPPPEAEWRFSAVRPEAEWGCFVYEYTREALINDPNDRLKIRIEKHDAFFKASENDDLDDNATLAGDGKLGGPLIAILDAVRPSQSTWSPWFDLNETVRNHIAAEFTGSWDPNQPTALPVCLTPETAIDGSTFDRLGFVAIQEANDATDILGLVLDRRERMRDARVVPFHIPPDWNAGMILAGFKQWLKENPEFHKTAKPGRKRRKWAARDYLRYLTVKRLIKHFSGASSVCALTGELGSHVFGEIGQCDEGHLMRYARKANEMIDQFAEGACQLTDFRPSE